LGTATFYPCEAFRKEVNSVAAKIQALLLVLGAIAAAAFGGSTPWGP
jgi:hypothetical protein